MFLQMTPKKNTTAHKVDKRMKMDNTRFRSTKHFEKYNQFFAKAPIIQEKFVDLVGLKDYFIPGCFQDRGWDKLLGDYVVYGFCNYVWIILIWVCTTLC